MNSPRLQRVLLVGDNRQNVNWGGRGASIALTQALARRFEVAGRVAGSDFRIESSGFGFVRTMMPASRSNWFHHAYANSANRRFYRWYVNAELKLGARDFVDRDPVRTAQLIISERSRHPFLARLYDAVKAADVLVLNGEGDFVFTTPARREALFMLGIIELAALLGTPVAFCNALISDCPYTGRNAQTVAAAYRTLRKCFAVCVRDGESLEFMRQHMPQIPCQLVPDSLFTWYPRLASSRSQLPSDGDFTIPYPERDEWFGRLRFDSDYVCVGGSAAAGLDGRSAVPAYCRLVQRLREADLRPILVEADGRDSFLEAVAEECDVPIVTASTPILLAGAILANARLLISGRYHAAILASLGGTPSILLKTTAHKMESLGALLGLPATACFPTLPDESQLPALVAEALALIGSGTFWRDRVAAAAAELCSRAEQLPDILSAALHQFCHHDCNCDCGCAAGKSDSRR